MVSPSVFVSARVSLLPSLSVNLCLHWNFPRIVVLAVELNEEFSCTFSGNCGNLY